MTKQKDAKRNGNGSRTSHRKSKHGYNKNEGTHTKKRWETEFYYYTGAKFDCGGFIVFNFVHVNKI